MVDRNSAPTEDDGTTSDTARPSGASEPSPTQGRRSLLADPDIQTRSFEGTRTTEGDTRPGRFDILRSFAASRQPSISRRGYPANDANDASESTVTDRGTVPSTRDSQVGETSSTAGTEQPRGRLDSMHAVMANRAARRQDFAAHVGAASDYLHRHPSIRASGDPSLILRVSTNDGGTGARVDPHAGGAPSAGTTSTVGGTSSARSTSTVGNPFPVGLTRMGHGSYRRRGGPAASPDAAAIPGRRPMGVPPAAAIPGRRPMGVHRFLSHGTQTAGDNPAVDDTIPADGALPAVGGVPAVGTMPAIGRVAYITVQSPDDRVSFPSHR